jgi:hypothetical protein
MKITIATRFCPFSHTPGAGCLVPGTRWQLRAFPTLLRFSHNSQQIDLSLQLTGPVKKFTLQQDLERKSIWIFGEAKEGYFRLRVRANDEGFLVDAEKTPPMGLMTSKGLLKSKDQLQILVELDFFTPSHVERISFGSHKKQDWDQVLRRLDLKEMIPIFLDLAQKIPPTLSQQSFFPEKKIAKMDIEPLLVSFFQAYFEQIFIPRSLDDQHQGIQGFPPLDLKEDPCHLIDQAARWIRALFFVQNERRLQILPNLPPSLEAGRFIDIVLLGMGTLDFEWSKFFLRKAVLRATTSGEVLFDLQKDIQSFRVRSSRWDKGYTQNALEPLLVESGKTYFLDHF